MESSVDRKSQAEASLEANADYNDPQSATRLTRVPQLPDPDVALHQSATQGGLRPVPEDVYDGVETRDDGSKIGEGASDPVDAAREAADGDDDAGAGSDGPTLADLRERAGELDISGRSSMNKDELAAAIAEAESDQ